ncbi:lipopolysaccharide assembly protein LapA domain-containing protein [uncultured Devosia sp.]|uniref:lipopolysaccharide assembly protein LapA domain-containing protein n=1 Tax=uncultured Devosia sp. TaxID=211434 RepID=UPI0035CBA6A4
MVKRIIGWLVLVPLCALLIVFALANRQVVALNFNPFVSPDLLQTSGYGVPLFLVLYVVLLVGVMLGGVATWFAQSQHRQRERHWRREAHALNGEIEALRKSQRHPSGAPLGEVDDLLELR